MGLEGSEKLVLTGGQPEKPKGRVLWEGKGVKKGEKVKESEQAKKTAEKKEEPPEIKESLPIPPGGQPEKPKEEEQKERVPGGAGKAAEDIYRTEKPPIKEKGQGGIGDVTEVYQQFKDNSAGLEALLGEKMEVLREIRESKRKHEDYGGPSHLEKITEEVATLKRVRKILEDIKKRAEKPEEKPEERKAAVGPEGAPAKRPMKKEIKKAKAQEWGKEKQITIY